MMPKWSRYNVSVQEDNGHALLFNTRTGALIRLSRARQIQTAKSIELYPDFLKFLLQQGFMVADDADEVQLVAAAHSAARSDDGVFSATIELTEMCNFRCLYCYQVHSPEYLTDQAFERVARYLARKMKGVRHLHVNWFGGEPLTRFGALRRFSQQLAGEARVTGCALSQFLTTNGYMLTPSTARELAELGIENVQITVDGDEEIHNRLRRHVSGQGTYSRVLSACANVVAAGMQLLMRINVNRWNARRIDGLLRDLAAKGITSANTVIHATRVVDHGNCSEAISSAVFTTREFAGEWISILEAIATYGFSLPSLAPIAYNCPFDLRQTVMIGRDGSIRHCSSSNGRIADLTETGEETNHTPLYYDVKERSPLHDSSCQECLYLPMCMGGCSYLQEIGQEKCIPERYVLPQLVLLTAGRAKNFQKGELGNGSSEEGTRTRNRVQLL